MISSGKLPFAQRVECAAISGCVHDARLCVKDLGLEGSDAWDAWAGFMDEELSQYIAAYERVL